LTFAASSGHVFAYQRGCGRACKPVWRARLGPRISARPWTLGRSLIVAAGEAIARIPLPCARRGQVCRPIWRAVMESETTIRFVDSSLLIVGVDSAMPRTAVFDPSCARICQALWSAPARGTVTSATSVRGAVVVGTSNGVVAAYGLSCNACPPVWEVEVDSGAVRWLFPRLGRILAVSTGHDYPFDSRIGLTELTLASGDGDVDMNRVFPGTARRKGGRSRSLHLQPRVVPCCAPKRQVEGN